ncbi:MAG TPA: class I SAM-dependent methyltransferase, partial [Candidatus Acidoferrales bacterium]|nr:class I SAM-dependent methyltransferase [Candidatus Acidoferrales bacterium]
GARTLLAREGVTNATLVLTAAESLPFLDASFDVATCRLAAHHFSDAAARPSHCFCVPSGTFSY